MPLFLPSARKTPKGLPSPPRPPADLRRQAAIAGDMRSVRWILMKLPGEIVQRRGSRVFFSLRLKPFERK